MFALRNNLFMRFRYATLYVLHIIHNLIINGISQSIYVFYFQEKVHRCYYCKGKLGYLLKQSSIAVMIIPIIISYPTYLYDHSGMKIKLYFSVSESYVLHVGDTSRGR